MIGFLLKETMKTPTIKKTRGASLEQNSLLRRQSKAGLLIYASLVSQAYVIDQVPKMELKVYTTC